MPACQPAEVREYQVYEHAPGQGIQSIRSFTFAEADGATAAIDSSCLRFSTPWDDLCTPSMSGNQAPSDSLLGLAAGGLVPPEHWTFTGSSAPLAKKVPFVADSLRVRQALALTSAAQGQAVRVIDSYLSHGERGDAAAQSTEPEIWDGTSDSPPPAMLLDALHGAVHRNEGPEFRGRLRLRSQR